jgi:thiamine transporter
VLVSVLRYGCHVLSGATVWAGISIPTNAALLYSLSYNATYMLPELLVTATVAYYLGSLIDFGGATLRPFTRRVSTPVADVLFGVSGLLVTGAVVFDIAFLFARVQDGETGELSLAPLFSQPLFDGPWGVVLIVTGAVALAVAALSLVRHRLLAKNT